MSLTTVVLFLLRRDKREAQTDLAHASDSEVEIVAELESPGGSVDRKMFV